MEGFNQATLRLDDNEAPRARSTQFLSIAAIHHGISNLPSWTRNQHLTCKGAGVHVAGCPWNRKVAHKSNTHGVNPCGEYLRKWSPHAIIMPLLDGIMGLFSDRNRSHEHLSASAACSLTLMTQSSSNLFEL